jgi:hypothetical protein
MAQKFAAFDRMLKKRGELPSGEHKINKEWTLSKRSDDLYALYHYTTCMLVWRDMNPEGFFTRQAQVLETYLGHSSVSDQQAMNQAFQVLEVPYYYSRKGGHGEIHYTR